MREPTEAEIAAVIQAMTTPAPAYEVPTNSLDRMNFLARQLAQAVISAGHSDPVGAAEQDVGRYIYQRIETLMDAKHVASIGNELDYLATIAAAVEEYGAEACGGEDLSVFKVPA